MVTGAVILISILLIVSMGGIMVFRFLEYGILQSIILGLFLSVPFLITLFGEKLKSLALILGGTDTNEVTRRFLKLVSERGRK